MSITKSYTELEAELEELRFQLQEANDAIQAIRTGKVDALLIQENNGPQLYTLKSANQTYRVFIEKMKEGAVTLNKEAIILYSNSQFASMVNLPLNKVIGLPFKEFIPDNYKERFDALVQQGWQSDSKGELPVKNKNGELIPFLLSFTSLELDEGMALSIILTNLSLQKATEKELQRKNELLEEARHKAATMNEELEVIVKERTKDLLLSREHFKFLADNIPVIVWTTNAEGNGDYFNKRWEEYTGYTFEESKDKAREIVHPDDFETSAKRWRDAVQRKEMYEAEVRFKRKLDGQYRWHHAHAIPFKDEEGKIVAWFGTSVDIEDQKKEMEKKDEFIVVASHELKTPLTSLKGYIQLVEQEEKKLPANVNQYIKKANESITKLQHLINDLLDVSMIHSGKLKFNTQRLDLSLLVNSCIENSQHIYSSYTIGKEIDERIFVRGNAERLEQVVMNLINNAVKYSPDNKEIIVKAKTDGTVVMVSVTDRGIGLSETHQKKIFERFYRVEDKKFRASGLGMGLYISSQIINEHNGMMNVKSIFGQGSTFSFTLSLAEPTK